MQIRIRARVPIFEPVENPSLPSPPASPRRFYRRATRSLRSAAWRLVGRCVSCLALGLVGCDVAGDSISATTPAARPAPALQSTPAAELEASARLASTRQAIVAPAADGGCIPGALCPPLPGEYRCDDGFDDDADGQTDCDDDECDLDPVCSGPLSEAGACDDGVDNDHDSRIDCADPACAREPHCEAIRVAPFTTAELDARFLQDCTACHPGYGFNFRASMYQLTTASGAHFFVRGDHRRSYVWLKLAGQQASVGDDGERMPRLGPYWTDLELARFAAWIDALPQDPP